MARFRTTMAIITNNSAGGPGQRIKAGAVVCDGTSCQGGDVIWPNLNANFLHAGMVPLDGGATAIKNASKYASEAVGQPSGRDSID
jgi:hypothetical protein